jgi:ketosteroid isomerase-like protein
LLTPPQEERRTGPLEPFERYALIGFALAALAEALLGSYRAHLAGESYLAPLLTAFGIAIIGALWLLRARHEKFGFAATPIGLLLATIGVYTGYSAMNAPFVSFLGRYAVPLLLVLIGALLLFAEQEWEFQRVPFVLAALAFVLAQVVLTNEARVGAKSIPSARVGGIIGEMQVVPIAQSFVAAINVHDAASIVAQTTPDHRFIDSLGNTVAAEQLRAAWDGYFKMVPDYRISVTRWIPDGESVVAYGTASGTFAETAWSTPAAWRAVIRDGKIAEWQVYADNEPIREIMRRSTK